MNIVSGIVCAHCKHYAVNFINGYSSLHSSMSTILSTRLGKYKMRWIENITIYAAANIQNIKVIELLTQFTHDESNPSPEKISIYRHSRLSKQMVILIHWESERPARDKSTLGLRIVETLKDFGMISHFAWVEEKSF